MFPVLRFPRRSFAAMLAVSLAGLAWLQAEPHARVAVQETRPALIPVDVAAFDRDGKLVDTLDAGDFIVTVDGKPRAVQSVRLVSRGPGAVTDATARLPRATATLFFAAESARNLLIVIDESSIRLGAEREAVQAAAALADRMGLDDRIGVIRMPIARDARVALTTGRPEVRDSLRQTTGRAVAAGPAGPDMLTPEQRSAMADPGRSTDVGTAANEREAPPAAAPLPDRAAEDETGVAPNALVSLRAMLTGMKTAPGRKVIGLFSAGLPPGSSGRVDDVAIAASAAHAVIYAFGLQEGHGELTSASDTAALERLARSTGGTFTPLGRNADRSIDHVVRDLGACYVLSIERAASDFDGKRHALRIETSRRQVVLRAPAWLVPHADAADIVPAALRAEPEAPMVTEGAAGAPAVRPAPPAKPSAEAAPRDAEAQRLLARAADYVSGYEREYSMLVAEETYSQNVRSLRQQTRSDLLLVHQEGTGTWVSFRDVFEVNGKPVRDREDRLRRLFLDPSAEAQTQLQAIKEESSRYNVPLFALKFLDDRNVWRSRFSVSGTKDVDGVATIRLAFQEMARPTMVRNRDDEDIAAKGWFLIDPVSGAITGSQMHFDFSDGSVIDFTVKYGRDTTMGMWVPVEMTEVFSRAGYANGGSPSVILDARATYSRFRRFQVKADTEITIKK